MLFQIINNGASIKIESETNHRVVMKHHIKGITVTGINKVSLKLEKPIDTIILPQTDVILPPSISAAHLVQIINDMITDCVCCNCGDGDPGPAE